MSKHQDNLYGIVFAGVMAAIVFVTTFFLKIQIPTPAGPTMLKVGNAVCLLGGMLFGGLYGGLAAGIGSALFDLTNPAFTPSAPFTLVFFFLMSFVCGTIANARGQDGKNLKLNIVAAAGGAVLYWFLNIGKSVVTLLIAGSAFTPALIANSTKMVTSGINVVIAVVISAALVTPFTIALERAGVRGKIRKWPLL
jgi:uncharacterized membrane protein